MSQRAMRCREANRFVTSVTCGEIPARDRVAGMTEPYLGSEREDLIAAMHEAERQLLVASRALRRAIKTADRG